MNYILFDNFRRNYLLPLTFTRPIAEIRFGILTIREKWEKYLKSQISYLTESYLSEKYPTIKQEDNVLINGSICPNKDLIKEIAGLKPNEALVDDSIVIALRLTAEELNNIDGEPCGECEIPTKSKYLKLNNTWDIFELNHLAIEEDFKLLTEGRKSAPLSSTNTVFNPENVFIEEGAIVECSILNASKGPIYIGKNTEVMEGSKIRGSFALCEGSVLKMDSKIYGATTIGPHSKVGGEIGNSVILGYSNKAHDGYMGNSVIGEWCNLGADTNTSNLKNTYEDVRLWSYPDQTFVNTHTQFCGLIMGDHSKSGINTMFNTGTVVGVNANVFGAGYQRNFIPSFSWPGMPSYNMNKAFKVAKAVYERRGKDFDKKEQDILKHIYMLTINNKRI